MPISMLTSLRCDLLFPLSLTTTKILKKEKLKAMKRILLVLLVVIPLVGCNQKTEKKAYPPIEYSKADVQPSPHAMEWRFVGPVMGGRGTSVEMSPVDD